MKAKTLNAVAAVIGVFCSFFTTSAFAAAKHVTLSCSGYTGTTTLTNFQSLVKLTEGMGGFSYSDCAANGTDLWFTDASGTTVYPHEVDTWNTSGESFVWVRLPELSPVAQGATSFTMHWGDAAEKAAHPCTTTDTWTGYAGVWHMNVSNDNEPDASGNGLAAVTNGNHTQYMTTLNGVVGKARNNQNASNNGNSLKISGYGEHITDAARFTLSGWFRASAKPSAWFRFFYSSKWDLYQNNSSYDTVTICRAISIGGTNIADPLPDTLPSNENFLDNWCYVVVVFDGTSYKLYGNGRTLGSWTGKPAVDGFADYFLIGNNSSNDRGWYGKYDEVRMYDGAQSTDRVKADYDTMNTPDTFLTFTTVATWTGAANDGDGANPLNWECSANGVVIAGQLPNETYRIQSCTLSRDCDWSGLGTAYFAEGAVVEMDGHSLTLPAVFGFGTVQNSATGDAKELTISVSSDWTNSDTSFAGNLKLVKGGAGTFTSFKAQTYTGGTVVVAGTAQPPARTSTTDLSHTYDNFKAFGTGEITVNVGGTFDVRGQYGYRNIITLNGGTWMSTGSPGMDNTRNDYSGVWRLTDDSFINVPESGFSIGNAGDLLDLDGHTLTVSVDSAKYFNSRFSYTENPGTVILQGAGFGISIYENSTIWATNVDFRISTRINLNANSQFHMHDYIALNTDNTLYTKTGSKLCVYGTFKPNAANNYFCGPEMQDNTTIDLSGMSGPWSNKSEGDKNYLVACKYVTFVNGARVNINLGSRRISQKEAIITWDSTSRPANLATLKFKGVFNDRTVTLSKRDDGLYMPRGLVIIVK